LRVDKTHLSKPKTLNHKVLTKNPPVLD